MNISALPAVMDANSPTGVFQKAIGREMGLGNATLSSCVRPIFIIVTSMAIGVFCGMVPIAGAIFAAMALPPNYMATSLLVLPAVGMIVGLIFFVLTVWGFYVLLSKLLYPNVVQAKKIMKTGEIPLDKIGRVLQAWEPTEAQQGKIDEAVGKLKSNDKLFFDRWFVLPSNHLYALSFGSYLFLSRGIIDGNSLEQVIAHELGHLNNGDSFVKCALWALGKGWTREYMSLGGKMSDPEIDRHVQMAGAGTIGYALFRRYWKVAVAEAALLSIVATNNSLQGIEEEARAYFWRWDFEADRVAETMFEPDGYQSYLKDLANFERTVGTMPLSAPAELRYDRTLVY